MREGRRDNFTVSIVLDLLVSSLTQNQHIQDTVSCFLCLGGLFGDCCEGWFYLWNDIFPRSSLLPALSCLSWYGWCLCPANNSQLMLISPRDITDHTHTNMPTFDSIREGWLENATTFRELISNVLLLRFPHLICPWNYPVKLTSDQHLIPLLFPLPSTPHLLSDTHLRSSFQLWTSQGGLYHWPEMSTAGPKDFSLPPSYNLTSLCLSFACGHQTSASCPPLS